MSASKSSKSSKPADRPRLPFGDSAALALTSAIHTGDLDTLRRLLTDRPPLACARMVGRNGVEGGWRTPLHNVAANWPGYFPHAPGAVQLLLTFGADPNNDSGGGRPETALHWAASSDDLGVAAALIDGGADLDTPGGSIGTPLDNAIGYGCWHVARLLVARGARGDRLWHAAALGQLTRVEELLLETEFTNDEVSQAFWHACSGRQRRAAELLLGCGADLHWRPDYADSTSLDAAMARSARQENVVGWLRECGAASARPGGNGTASDG